MTEHTCPYANVGVVPSTNADNNKDRSEKKRERIPSFSSTSTHESSSLLPSSPPSPKRIYEAFELARTKCPAFTSSSSESSTNIKCPFRNAKDGNDIRDIVVNRVPPSHVTILKGGNDEAMIPDESKKEEIHDSFKLALEHVHRVGRALHTVNDVGNVLGVGSSGNQNNKVGEPAFVVEGGCPFRTLYRGGVFVHEMDQLSTGVLMRRMVDEDSDVEDEVVKHDGISSSAKESTATLSSSTEVAEKGKVVHEQHQQEQQQRQRVSRQSLSNALQNGTADSHKAAESVHFVHEFIRGNIDRRLYSSLILSLYHIYSTLEPALEEHASHHFSSLHHPKELNRVKSLEDDVEFWHGEAWKDDKNKKMSVATRDYVNRIRWIAENDPLLLLSHAYTRYLGDLSGGKILGRVARRALGLERGCDDGLRFYKFENVKSAKKFKDAYRRDLDDLGLKEDDVARLVGEANVAFVLNMRIFEELDVEGGVEGAKVRPLEEALSYFDRVVDKHKRSDVEEEEGKCPFGFVGGVNPHNMSSSSQGSVKTSSPSSPSSSGTDRMKEMQKKSVEDYFAEMSLEEKGKGRCPWPFIFFHDPVTGMQDYQTWVVIGLLLCWIWSRLQ